MKLIGVYDYTVILTYLSLFSAVFGMIRASQGGFTLAVVCLFFSGFCDAFDGIVARSKKDRTEDEKAFGIQLDSLCDVIAFGVFPAFLCYFMGVDGILGLLLAFFFSMCAVARLAFFNVLEAKRQKTEGGCNKTYRGLPVTSISLIFPVVYYWVRRRVERDLTCGEPAGPLPRLELADGIPAEGKTCVVTTALVSTPQRCRDAFALLNRKLIFPQKIILYFLPLFCFSYQMDEMGNAGDALPLLTLQCAGP